MGRPSCQGAGRACTTCRISACSARSTWAGTCSARRARVGARGARRTSAGRRARNDRELPIARQHCHERHSRQKVKPGHGGLRARVDRMRHECRLLDDGFKCCCVDLNANETRDLAAPSYLEEHSPRSSLLGAARPHRERLSGQASEMRTTRTSTTQAGVTPSAAQAAAASGIPPSGAITGNLVPISPNVRMPSKPKSNCGRASADLGASEFERIINVAQDRQELVTQA